MQCRSFYDELWPFHHDLVISVLFSTSFCYEISLNLLCDMSVLTMSERYLFPNLSFFSSNSWTEGMDHEHQIWAAFLSQRDVMEMNTSIIRSFSGRILTYFWISSVYFSIKFLKLKGHLWKTHCCKWPIKKREKTIDWSTSQVLTNVDDTVVRKLPAGLQPENA